MVLRQVVLRQQRQWQQGLRLRPPWQRQHRSSNRRSRRHSNHSRCSKCSSSSGRWTQQPQPTWARLGRRRTSASWPGGCWFAELCSFMQDGCCSRLLAVRKQQQAVCPRPPAHTQALTSSAPPLPSCCRLAEDRAFLLQAIPEHPPEGELDWELIARHFGRCGGPVHLLVACLPVSEHHGMANRDVPSKRRPLPAALLV